MLLRSFSLLAVLLLAQASPAPAAVPETWILAPEILVGHKERLRKGDPELQSAHDPLVSDAKNLMKQEPLSVTGKKLLPASGDIHDYFSFGIYWWPDPEKPDGLPYIQRDGQRNPAARDGNDADPFTKTNRAVGTLGLAYHFTDDSGYARKAAELTRVWYLNPETRMNPNMNHAQAIPGITDGRSVGLIEATHLSELLDGIVLIRTSRHWTPNDEMALRHWLEKFYQWLTTSPNGRGQEDKVNNLGVYYDILATHIALILGKSEEADARLAQALSRRIDRQIAPDGRMPHELNRTLSLGYSVFTMEAFLHLATLAERRGQDWWQHRGPEGQSLKAALDLLAPYADPDKAWEFGKQIEPLDHKRILALIQQGLNAIDDKNWRALMEEFGAAHPSAGWRLIY